MMVLRLKGCGMEMENTPQLRGICNEQPEQKLKKAQMKRAQNKIHGLDKQKEPLVI
jgi:hypothetical protein